MYVVARVARLALGDRAFLSLGRRLVAARASDLFVLPAQWEARFLVVIERRLPPLVRAVTVLALLAQQAAVGVDDGVTTDACGLELHLVGGFEMARGTWFPCRGRRCRFP